MRTWLVALAMVMTASCASGAQRADTTASALAGLPLVEVAPNGGHAATMAIFLSGDGGWADLDRQVSSVLASHGLGVVGLNSRSYLSSKKTPEQTAADVERIARTYMARWKADRLVLVGYSRGADMVPFVANRLPADVRERVVALAMLGLAKTANFHFHLIDVVKEVQRPDDIPVAPELERLRGGGARMLCVYGTQEKDSGCRAADSTLISKVERKGGHHFDGDFRGLGELIVRMLPEAY
jgi:type IV secretory pathway VirJ component